MPPPGCAPKLLMIAKITIENPGIFHVYDPSNISSIRKYLTVYQLISAITKVQHAYNIPAKNSQLDLDDEQTKTKAYFTKQLAYMFKSVETIKVKERQWNYSQLLNTR